MASCKLGMTTKERVTGDTEFCGNQCWLSEKSTGMLGITREGRENTIVLPVCLLCALLVTHLGKYIPELKKVWKRSRNIIKAKQ